MFFIVKSFIMKLVSWNVAGIRARLKNGHIDNLLSKYDIDILCIQETKAEEKQVALNSNITDLFPHRYWNSSQGITQRKGFSGTSIWSKIKPIKQIDSPDFDLEGRTVILEFDSFIIINVYTPNSQALDSIRFNYRNEWDCKFRIYFQKLNTIKPTIICGDFNVAHNDIDIVKPKLKKNKIAGFLDKERENFESHLVNCNYIDIFRFMNPNIIKYTYWSNFLKTERSNNNGWRIDYFILPENIISTVSSCDTLIDILGSDHCPIYIDINY